MQVIAIALQTIRTAVRLKLVLSLLVLLTIAMVGVPATVKGEGTAVSDVHVLLFYTLGLAVVILAIATLWASCAAISSEVEGRQVRLLAVKPVRFASLWFGKWLGIVVLDAVLLVAVGTAVFAWVQRVARDERWSAEERLQVEEEILQPRRLLLPRPPDLDPLVAARLDEISRRGAIPEGVSECDLADDVRKRVAAEYAAVAAGRSRTWIFDEVPATSVADGYVLRYRMASSIGGGGRVTGEWQVLNEDAGMPFTCAVDRRGGRRARLAVPRSAVDRSGPVSVTFANAPRDRSMTAIFEGDAAVELLCGRTPFARNYVVALLAVLALLATLAALGVTAGTLFTFPVASFAALAVALIVVTANAFVHMPGGDEEGCSHPGHHHDAVKKSVLRKASEFGLQGIATLVRPVAASRPLSCLADGVAVPGRSAAWSIGLFGFLYPLLLALPGIWCLGRRELAG